jgi:hypothetical protein
MARTLACESLVPQSAMLSNQAGDSGSAPPVSSAVANRSPGLFRESSSCWKLFSFGMGRRIYSKWKWKCNGVPIYRDEEGAVSGSDACFGCTGLLSITAVAVQTLFSSSI